MVMLFAWTLAVTMMSIAIHMKAGGSAYAPYLYAGWALFVLPITYVPLLLLLNATTIDVTPAVLSIRHGPLPWFDSADVPVEKVADIFIDSYRTPGARGAKGGRAYTLHARLINGSEVELLTNALIGDPDTAQRLADTLREWLDAVRTTGAK